MCGEKIRTEILTSNNAAPADVVGNMSCGCIPGTSLILPLLIFSSSGVQSCRLAKSGTFPLAPGCVQITVEGTSGDPNVGVSIPGYASKSTPGLIFDTRNPNSFSNYPAVFGLVLLSPAAGAGVSSPPPTRTTMETVTTTPALTKIPVRSPAPSADNDQSPTPPESASLPHRRMAAQGMTS